MIRSLEVSSPARVSPVLQAVRETEGNGGECPGKQVVQKQRQTQEGTRVPIAPLKAPQ